MPDRQTLGVYGAAVADYSRMLAGDPNAADRAAFLAPLPAGGRVLDLGCGPGRDAAAMARAGLRVEAWDATPEMAAAAAHPSVATRCASFDDLDAVARYDGIWAAFSLLHARRADLPGRIAAIHAALVPGGRLYLAMKLGSGSQRDALGRYYTYVSETELAGWLATAGFTVSASRKGHARGLAGTDDPFICVFAHA